MAYHGYVSSVAAVGRDIWGNSVVLKNVRAIYGAWFDYSLFKKLNVLPLPCVFMCYVNIIRDICVFVNTHPQYSRIHGEVIQKGKRANIMNLLLQLRCRKVIYINNSSTCV